MAGGHAPDAAFTDCRNLICAAARTPGPGEYGFAHTSKQLRAPAAGFGCGSKLAPPTLSGRSSPGPGAYSPCVAPARPSSPCFSFHGVDDGSRGMREAVPGPASYSGERADGVTRPSSPAATMHQRLTVAYIPKASVGPSPASYSPTRPGSSSPTPALRHQMPTRPTNWARRALSPSRLACGPPSRTRPQGCPVPAATTWSEGAGLVV